VTQGRLGYSLPPHHANSPPPNAVARGDSFTFPSNRAYTFSKRYFWPKEFTNGHIRWDNFCSLGEPKHLEEAFGHDCKWKETMDGEFSAMMHNRTWHLVPSPQSNDIIDGKCVYKIKNI
jgi:hypothetical protein